VREEEKVTEVSYREMEELDAMISGHDDMIEQA
jgi:hypothetical protein